PTSTWRCRTTPPVSATTRMTSPRKRGPHGKPPSAGTPAGPTSSQSSGSPRFARSDSSLLCATRGIQISAFAACGRVRTIVAILMATSLSEQMPLADVKNRLSEVVDRLEREHGRVVITKHGHPAAVVMSLEDLESLEETLDVMDSAELLADIRSSLAEVASP